MIAELTERFCLGAVIVLPHVWYMRGKKGGEMFHVDTHGCDDRDRAGLCNRHPMKRQAFMEKYCKGVEPRRLA